LPARRQQKLLKTQLFPLSRENTRLQSLHRPLQFSPF
jgi:hypothetical protein